MAWKGEEESSQTVGEGARTNGGGVAGVRAREEESHRRGGVLRGRELTRRGGQRGRGGRKAGQRMERRRAPRNAGREGRWMERMG